MDASKSWMLEFVDAGNSWMLEFVDASNSSLCSSGVYAGIRGCCNSALAFSLDYFLSLD